MEKLLPAFLILIFSTANCATRLAQMTPAQRSERLAIERGRLADKADAVGRTRSYITISQILLTFASDAIRENTLSDLQGLLRQYVETIQNAKESMLKSDRNPERHAAGFKELEISMRGQLRLLEDMSNLLSASDRKPIEDAMRAATSVRDDMLRSLFPQASTSTSKK